MTESYSKLEKFSRVVRMHSYSVIMLFPKCTFLAIVRQDTHLGGLSLLS